jgi:hypothetical protein
VAGFEAPSNSAGVLDENPDLATFALGSSSANSGPIATAMGLVILELWAGQHSVRQSTKTSVLSGRDLTILDIGIQSMGHFVLRGYQSFDAQVSRREQGRSQGAWQDRKSGLGRRS